LGRCAPSEQQGASTGLLRRVTAPFAVSAGSSSPLHASGAGLLRAVCSQEQEQPCTEAANNAAATDGAFVVADNQRPSDGATAAPSYKESGWQRNLDARAEHDTWLLVASPSPSAHALAAASHRIARTEPLKLVVAHRVSLHRYTCSSTTADRPSQPQTNCGASIRH
jgi:hypothetical protein